MATATYAGTLPLPWAVQAKPGDPAQDYGGQDMRYLLGAMYNRTGRIGLGDSLWLVPNPAGADWSVSVTPGQAILAGAGGSGTYAPERYLVTVPYATGTTPINIPLTGLGWSLPPVGTRVHAVWVAVTDASVSGTGYKTSLIVTEDTGSGAPNPTGVTYIFKIGTITMNPGQTAVGLGSLATTMQRASRATSITALSYASGYATYVSGTIGQPLSYSVDGNTVRLQGTAYRTAGDMVAGTTYTVGTLPAGYRPAYARILPGVTVGPVAFRCVVATSGDIQVTAIGTNIAYAAFDGIAFELF